jgi:hypothetical protein
MPPCSLPSSFRIGPVALPWRGSCLARQLKESFSALERADAPLLPVPLGCGAMRAALPRGGLDRGAPHEIAPASSGDGPAALGFVAALSARGLADTEGGGAPRRLGREPVRLRPARRARPQRARPRSGPPRPGRGRGGQGRALGLGGIPALALACGRGGVFGLRHRSQGEPASAAGGRRLRRPPARASPDGGERGQRGDDPLARRSRAGRARPLGLLRTLSLAPFARALPQR